MKPRISPLALNALLASSLAVTGCGGQVIEDDAIPDEEDAAEAELGTRPEDYAEVLRLAHQAGGLECNSRAVIAAAISRAESSFRVGVVAPEPPTRCVPSDNWSAGLWQINKCHGYTQEQLKDPATNARAMAEVSNNGTKWTPWTMYNNGGYRRYLAAAWSAHATYGCDGASTTSGPPPLQQDGPSGTCPSASYPDKSPAFKISECVLSRFDSRWYQCTELGWVKLYADGTGYVGYCTDRYPRQ
jgi:hypothetical protein